MSQFPIFNSYLDLGYQYWQKILKPGDWAIDATCGNGKDTLKLAQLVQGSGRVISMDIQDKAIENSNNYFKSNLTEEELARIHLFQASHETFPPLAFSHPIRLIVYNLGYLPGGDKKITTLSDITLKSLMQALSLLMPGGLIAITCYPGHLEGEREQALILSFIERLDPSIWNICHHTSLNRIKSPTLVLIQKNT